MNDEDLRRAFTTPGGLALRPEECPEPETIWAAVHGELPPGELRDVVDHTATCAACAEDWRLAVEMDREEVVAALIGRPAAAVAAVRPVLYPRRWTRFAPLAAAAAAIVLLVVSLPRLPHEEEKNLRGRLGPVTSRLKEDRPLARDHCLLLWTEIPGASYDLEVRTVLTGELVFVDGGLGAPYDPVPAWSLANVRSGDRLEAKITAHLDGSVSHGTFTFKLR